MTPSSKRTSHQLSAKVLSIALIWASVILSVGALYGFLRNHPAATSFTFRPYAVMSFLPLIVNVWIIILIRRLKFRTEEAVWFMLYVAALSIACLGEGLQRLSVSPAGAVFWFQFNGIGYAIMPIAYFLFVLSYMRPLRQLSPLLIPSMLISSCVVLFLFVATSVFFSLDPRTFQYFPWGFNMVTTGLFPLYAAWVELPLIASVIGLISYRRFTTNKLEIQQARVYIWALVIPLAGGTVTDAILPAMGINSVVPLSLFLSTVTSLIAYYGLRRYRSFQVNPAEYGINVIRSMHEAVVVTKADYRIDFVNREAERLLGAESSKLLGGNLQDRFGVESWQAIMSGETGEAAVSGDSRHAVDRLHVINLDGSQVPVRVYMSELELGDQDKTLIFIITDITDITRSYHRLEESSAQISSQNRQLQENAAEMSRLLEQEKRLEKQLEHEKANVEHTVEVRTAELREARDKLKEADKMKSEFIMLSSHNLRTPLTIMSTSIELLCREADNLSDQQKNMIQSLAGGTERLGEFIEDLLAIATLEAGSQLALSPVKLREILEPLTKETQSIAEDKGLQFHTELLADNPTVKANALRLRSAIRNILHNAVQYTDSGDIWLKTESNEGTVRVVVRDSGVGISEEEVGQLFTKFHRGTSTLVYNYEGEGIGLYLTKLVVEEHGGTIKVDSTPGEGTTFTIELPIANEHTKEAETVPSEESVPQEG